MSAHFTGNATHSPQRFFPPVMKLHLSRLEGLNQITGHGPGHVLVNGMRFETGLIILPDDSAQPVLDAIHASTRSLRIKMFAFSHRPLLDAVVAAHHRGVMVKVMLNPVRRDGETDNDRARDLLQEFGIEVTESSPAFGLTHEKSMVVDDEHGRTSEAADGAGDHLFLVAGGDDDGDARLHALGQRAADQFRQAEVADAAPPREIEDQDGNEGGEAGRAHGSFFIVGPLTPSGNKGDSWVACQAPVPSAARASITWAPSGMTRLAFQRVQV